MTTTATVAIVAAVAMLLFGGLAAAGVAAFVILRRGHRSARAPRSTVAIDGVRAADIEDRIDAPTLQALVDRLNEHRRRVREAVALEEIGEVIDAELAAYAAAYPDADE